MSLSKILQCGLHQTCAIESSDASSLTSLILTTANNSGGATSQGMLWVTTTASSIVGFICFEKLKNCVALANRVQCVLIFIHKAIYAVNL